MKTLFYFFSKSLLCKLALIAALIVGGGNAAWADAVLLPYDYNFDNKTNSNIVTDGWSYTGYGSTGVATFGGVGSSYCFRFYPNESVQYLYSPQIPLTGNSIAVSFSYKGYGSSYPVVFYVGYKSAEASDFTWGEKQTYASTNWTTYEDTYPIGTAYIAIKYDNSTSYYYLFVDNFHAEEVTPYPTPVNFALIKFTETSATFSWTAGNNETTWQFDYSTDSDFTPGSGINGTSVSLTSNPYTLSGLTTGTTYYASIRADYGNGNYSEWTDKVSFTPRAEVETTINNGNSTNTYVPFNGNYVSSITNSQFIIPASSLSDVVNRQITKLTFYSYNANKSWGKAEFEVYMKESSNTTFSSAEYDSWGTCVFNSASLSVDTDKLLTIELSTPFNYQGGNLQIGVKLSETGSFSSNSFYGVNGSSYTTIYGTGGSLTRTQFLPKITITSTPITTDPVQMGSNGYTTFASHRALDLSNLPSGLTAYKAEVDAANSKVRFTEINQAVPANTGILLAGTAGETYSIPVADNGTAVENNDFFVNSTGGTFAAESGYTYFGLLKDSDPLTFGTFAPETVAIPTNKAYLKVANSGASRLTCLFYNETEGIQSMEHKSLSSEVYYNLAGQRVDKPSKGLYIVNGKKVIIK